MIAWRVFDHSDWEAFAGATPLGLPGDNELQPVALDFHVFGDDGVVNWAMALIDDNGLSILEFNDNGESIAEWEPVLSLPAVQARVAALLPTQEKWSYNELFALGLQQHDEQPVSWHEDLDR